MTPQFILWGLPGFIAYYLLHVVKPSRTKSGWDFVVEVGVLSVACFLIARGLVYYGGWLFPRGVVYLRQYWPREYSFTLALGMFPVAEMVGVILGATSASRASFLSRYHELITGKERNFEFADIFFTTCNDLLGETTLVTLSSGKVYVGILIGATQDPNETKRFLQLIPLLSGYRRPEKLLVEYTTFYEPSTDRRRAFLLPVDQLTLLARFDWQLFNHFVQAGVITLDVK